MRSAFQLKLLYISSVYNTAKVEYLLCGSLGRVSSEAERTEQMVPSRRALVGGGGGTRRRDFSCVSGRHATSVTGRGQGCLYL